LGVFPFVSGTAGRVFLDLKIIGNKKNGRCAYAEHSEDLARIFSACAEATRLERARCLQAVEDEPDLPGKMPDAVWDRIRGDRDAIEVAIRLVVKLTKLGIWERIENP
jgi:hypothetical protein